MITELFKRFTGQQDQNEADAEILASLTAREREILTLIAMGETNADICASLYIADTTVKTHVSRIFSKLRVRHRSQAVTLAFRSGLVQPKTARRSAQPQTEHCSKWRDE